MRAKKTGLDQLSGLFFSVWRDVTECVLLNKLKPETRLFHDSEIQRLHGGTGRGSHVGRTVPLGSFRNEKGKKLLREFKQQRRLRQPKSPLKKKNIITLRLLLHARILCCWKSTPKMDW